MRRELKAEWAKSEFDKAMSAFQSDCPIIKKTKSVKTNAGELAYKYAPLESIVEQVKDILSKHGFSYSVDQPSAKQGYIKVAGLDHVVGHVQRFRITSDLSKVLLFGNLGALPDKLLHRGWPILWSRPSRLNGKTQLRPFRSHMRGVTAWE